jgi:hypothetical protein
MLFKGSISEGYGQKIKFTLIDTLTLNLSSETFSGHIVTFSRDSLFYYMDEGEPQRNGGKYLTLNVVDCNSKIRKNILLEDAGDDIDIFMTSFLLVTDDHIILGFRDDNIIFFNKKGKLLQRMKKGSGYLNFAYLPSSNRLILIDNYAYHILDSKPLLKLL